jgi:hypothetical protein
MGGGRWGPGRFAFIPVRLRIVSQQALKLPAIDKGNTFEARLLPTLLIVLDGFLGRELAG